MLDELIRRIEEFKDNSIKTIVGNKKFFTPEQYDNILETAYQDRITNKEYNELVKEADAIAFKMSCKAI